MSRDDRIAWIDGAFMAAIAFLSIWFGYERSLLLDGSYRIYALAEFHQVPIWNSRYTSGLNFILPLLASFADVSLRTIVNAQVINYLIFPLGVYAFLKFRQSSLKYEVAFLFGYALFNTSAFFFASYEWWVGAFLYFALYRVLDDDAFIRDTRMRAAAGGLLIATVLFSHLNAIFCIPILVAHLYAGQRIDRRSAAVYLFLTVLYLALKMTVLASPYEQRFVSGTTPGLSALVSILSSVSIKAFAASLVTTNANVLLLLGLAGYKAKRERNYLPLALTLAGLAVSILLVGYFFPQYGYNVYTEGWFKMVNLLIAVLAAEALFAPGFERIRIPVIGANHIFAAAVILAGSGIYTARYDLIAEICAENTGPVVIRTDADLCPSSFMTMPMESSIISQLENRSMNFFTLEIRGHAATTDVLESHRSSEPGRYFDFTQAAEYLPDTALDEPIGKLAYDRYTTYDCVEFVRVY